MTVAMDPVVPTRDAPARYANWTPIILGALMATALSTILLAFGATIGLGVASAAPTWRDASAALAILSGLYLIIQAALSFGVGGYIAGRTRSAPMASDVSETEHRDGLHGLAAWALAVVLGTLLTALVSSISLTRSNASLPATQTSAAEPLLSYELDRLFRGGQPCGKFVQPAAGRDSAAAAIRKGVQGAHAFSSLVGEEPGCGNNLVKLQVQVTEIRAHNVPVGLLSLQVQFDEIGKHRLQIAGQGG